MEDGILQMWLSLMTLIWGDYPGLSRCSQSNHINLYKGRIFLALVGEKSCEDGNRVRETLYCWLYKWGPHVDHEVRNVDSL